MARGALRQSGIGPTRITPMTEYGIARMFVLAEISADYEESQSTSQKTSWSDLDSVASGLKLRTSAKRRWISLSPASQKLIPYGPIRQGRSAKCPQWIIRQILRQHLLDRSSASRPCWAVLCTNFACTSGVECTSLLKTPSFQGTTVRPIRVGSGSRLSPEAPAGAPIPASSPAGIPPRRRIRVPGTDPCRNACATSLRAS